MLASLADTHPAIHLHLKSNQTLSGKADQTHQEEKLRNLKVNPKSMSGISEMGLAKRN